MKKAAFPKKNDQHNTPTNYSTIRELRHNVVVGIAWTAPVWIVVVWILAVRP